MITAPCLNCTDRVLGCHDTCEKYIQYKQELSEIKEIERKRKLSEQWTPRWKK